MNKLGRHAKRQRNVSNAMQSEKLEHRTSTNRGTARRMLNNRTGFHRTARGSTARGTARGSTAPIERFQSEDVNRDSVSLMQGSRAKRRKVESDQATGLH